MENINNLAFGLVKRLVSTKLIFRIFTFPQFHGRFKFWLNVPHCAKDHFHLAKK